jgi:methylmalonyl-CoA mutase
LLEFDRITERGGVLGLWNDVPTFKIQERSLYYETLKHTGEFPIWGKYFLEFKGSPTVIPAEVIRATEEEKQINTLENLHKADAKQVQVRLEKIQDAAIKMKIYLTNGSY